jgi:DMSO/TMAO reductase YedYZ molybdopterin-dependent catalytic subunit
MNEGRRLSRRGLLTGVAAASTALLGGCEELSDQAWVKRILESGEALTRITQEALLSPQALAREYDAADLSREFKANGSTNPDDPVYVAHAENGFADWKLSVGGLVEAPLELSLAELRAMPSRTQITRHDCVEGWSCIGKWTGTPLAALLQRVGVRPQARFVMFHCADTMEDSVDRYYESIGLGDAFHPQTILAYDMNGAPLSVAHGAPLRVRVERQLGYKMAKYVMAIELVESFSHIGRGHGGFWEDRGYEWYAGI